MKYTRFATSVVLSGSLALMSAGSAFAADSIDTTGPGSTNTVTENNTNNQTATTGNATVSGNTNAGSATTGDATNNNTTQTTVGVAGSGSGNGGGVFGSGNGAGAGVGSTGTVGSGQGNGGGSVLGASTTGSTNFGQGAGSEATLPVTGPSSPIDVSALRTQNHASVIPPALVKQSNGISAALLLAAATLSLLGAIGSAVYANRREQQL
jgi:hypothetical protein